MAREVKRDVATDADGNKTVTKTVHIDRPRKTIEKVVVKKQDADTGEVHKTRSKSVEKK